MPSDFRDDLANDTDVQLVWNYLAPHTSPVRSDAVFVFGGIDLTVPAQAAALWRSSMAPTILITGGSGALTASAFEGPEAEQFRQIMLEAGVPPSAIVSEANASNTGENVSFGMKALQENTGSRPVRLLLVAKPFLMRRCLATFQRQYPEVVVMPCPPTGELRTFVDRPDDEFAIRLADELKRLRNYNDAGFISEVEIPQDVAAAETAIRSKYAAR